MVLGQILASVHLARREFADFAKFGSRHVAACDRYRKPETGNQATFIHRGRAVYIPRTNMQQALGQLELRIQALANTCMIAQAEGCSLR